MTATPEPVKFTLEARAYMEKQAKEISVLNKKLTEKDVQAFEANKASAKALDNLNKLHAERQKAYLDQIDAERIAHMNEQVKVRKLYREGTEKIQKELDSKIEEIKNQAALLLKIRREAEELQKKKNSENFTKTFKLQTELSVAVKTKKLIVADLQDKMQKQQLADEQKLRDMNEEIKRLERECLSLGSTAVKTKESPKKEVD